jgi:hypothetical protein
MGRATYECRNCKTVNEFDPDPNVQLLIENKEPDRTYEIKSRRDVKSRSPKVYTLRCSNCGTMNSVTY